MLRIREDGFDFQGQKWALGRDFDQIFDCRDDTINAPGRRSLANFCQVLFRVMMVVRKPLSYLNTQSGFSTRLGKRFWISYAAYQHHWLIAEFFKGISMSLAINQAGGTKLDSDNSIGQIGYDLSNSLFDRCKH